MKHVPKYCRTNIAQEWPIMRFCCQKDDIGETVLFLDASSGSGKNTAWVRSNGPACVVFQKNKTGSGRRGFGEIIPGGTQVPFIRSTYGAISQFHERSKGTFHRVHEDIQSFGPSVGPGSFAADLHGSNTLLAKALDQPAARQIFA